MMKKGSKRWSQGVLLVLVPTILVTVGGLPGQQTEVLAWGEHGHQISGRAAALKVPKEMPDFFRRSIEQLTYLNPEPDRWRDRAEATLGPALNAATAPEHYIDFENVNTQAMAAPERYAYLAQAAKDGFRADQVGLLPFTILELFQRLRVEFRLWRATSDPQRKRWIEQRIINDAGILGHYVTDGANPHHTTIHHNGWVGANPKGYATDKQFHARFESDFVGRQITIEDLLPKISREARVLTDTRAEIIAYLQRSHSAVERLYELDKRVKFTAETTAPQHKEFAVERLAAGAAMLRDLWWTAWVTSGPATAVKGNGQGHDFRDAQVLWRIDVGNTSTYTDREGKMWAPDTGLFTPERAFAERRGEPEIAGAGDPTIYRTYRGNVGGKTPQAERQITFNIPVPGHREVDLRLHFAELYWGAPGGGPPGPGRRVFDVLAEGKLVLENFDITTASGGRALAAVVVPVRNVRVEDGTLTLTLKAQVDFPAISAIEVYAHTGS